MSVLQRNRHNEISPSRTTLIERATHTIISYMNTINTWEGNEGTDNSNPKVFEVPNVRHEKVGH